MIIFLADVHIGVKLSYDDFHKALLINFDQAKKEAMIRDEEIDAIFVCGDLFDHALNTDEMVMASGLIMTLALNHCGCHPETPNAPVYIIEGTFSHDRNQMKIFENMLCEIPHADVHYYRTHSSFVLKNGLKVLALPQEYGNVDYTKAFSETYDLIVGHGPISSKNKTVVESHGTEIMHSVEQLSSISKLCVFGHYHEYTDFGNGVYYAGSFLRFRYGEDIPKVFCMCDKNLKLITYPNTIAKEFKTVEINDPEQLRDALSHTENHDFNRYIIHLNDEDHLKTYRAIMETTKSPNVKFKVVDDFIPTEEQPVGDMTNDNSVGVEPIVGLIVYISNKYKIDATKEIRDYESKIKKEE